MKCIESRLVTLQIIPCVLCGLMFGGPSSSGQDRDSDGIKEEDLPALSAQKIAVPPSQIILSARTRASNLLKNYELVADGEFYALPDASSDELSALNPENVLVRFRILDLYRGSAPNFVEIELINDMLIFPGGDVSRHTKRQQVRDAQFSELQAIREQLAVLERAFEAGEIALLEYENETARLAVLEEQLVRERLATSRRQFLVVHGKTFYDRGGAIRPNQRYLIGVNRIPHRAHVYRLDEDTINIFWGEMRDDLVAALNDLTR